MSFHDVPGINSSWRIHRRFRTHGTSSHFFVRAFAPKDYYASADFCPITPMLPRRALSGFQMITLTLPADACQTDLPDKNVNFPCTTAAFTLSP